MASSSPTSLVWLRWWPFIVLVGAGLALFSAGTRTTAVAGPVLGARVFVLGSGFALAVFLEVMARLGRVVWSLKEYGFLAAEQAPPTVNPSLWRQARLNMHHGLFRVTERLYQIRGFDIS